MRGRPRPRRLTAPRSISSGNTGCSCRSPPVSTTTIGLPPRSHRRWTFVPYPPRLRPRASVAGSPLSPRPRAGAPGPRCCRRSGASSPAVGVRPPLQRGKDAIPHPRPLPAVEAAGDRLPRVVALRQGPPRAARAQDPEDAVEDGAVVVGGTAGAGLLRREQGTQPFPLCVGQLARFHATKGRASEGLRTGPGALGL